MNIAIIGGSISGCALALFLKDKFDVTVFERANDLKSRGAGITMSKELLQTLISKGIIDKEIQTCSPSSRSFYCQSPTKPDYGHPLWQQDISIVSLHWDTLFTNLRKRLPDSLYQKKCQVTHVALNEGGPGQITLESGDVRQFDLIVFADGSHSMGRALISEHSQLAYSGYVAWRGIIDFDLIKDRSPFINNIPYYCFNNGHLLAYPVYQDDIKKLNWVFYEKLSIDALNRLSQTSQIDFSDTAKQHVHQLAKSKLPNAMAQVVIDTKSPFMQKIVDVGVERLVTKAALLLGDAGLVLRPHVGNGASLAIQDALNLSEQLNNHAEFQQALVQWEQGTLTNRLSMYALSKRMGDALVLNPVLWQGMDKTTMSSWWDRILHGEQWYTTNNQMPLSLK